MEWLRAFLAAVASEEVMRALILVGVGVISHQLNKTNRSRTLTELSIDIVDFIEEHYKDWGIRGDAKMARFIELFAAEFKGAVGRRPTQDELRRAQLCAEAAVQRARRATGAQRARPAGSPAGKETAPTGAGSSKKSA